VVAQFSAAIILIIGTLIATQQLLFMQKRETGFDRDQVVILPLSRIANQKYDVIKQELLKNTAITGVTGSGQRLGNNFHQSSARFKSDSGMRELTTSQVLVDYDYLSFYNIELLEGRNFSKERGDNGRGYIINESMARELLKGKPDAPLKSLLGKGYAMGWEDSLGTIIGIARDFNFNSLHHKVETLTMEVRKEWGYSEMSVRIDVNRSKEALSYMEDVWNKNVPDLFFDYTFLDHHFAKMYQSDRQVSVVMSILAGLAIFIACLGLFGLATFTAQKRTKEIGIRKVVGASIFQITTLLSKDFLKLVLIAFVIATPIAWIGMSKWLEDFAFRINISVWVFVWAGIAALFIALLTIGYQSIKAAIANPVKSLRSE
jgi:putative ABC transport system permease protein